MDARQRLNQLRRFKAKGNRNTSIQKRKRLTDLRQLIARNDNKSVTNVRHSVKTRIGFKTKNKDQSKQLQLFTNKNRGRDNRKQTNRVLSNDYQKLPTVVVDLSQIDDSRAHPSTSSVASYSKHSSGVVRNKANAANDSKNTVLVSNLNQMITDSEIKELFGEIGPIVKSSKINSSVALIVYHNEVDARKACNAYHNRLLDGMPMQCNTLSLSNDEYAIESRPRYEPRPEPTYSRRSHSQSLLASQLRQINALHPQPRAQTSANKRSNRSNTRFVVNF